MNGNSQGINPNEERNDTFTSEEEKEKALIELIIQIVVKATLKEYYNERGEIERNDE